MIEQSIRVPSTDVPEYIVNGEPGKYPIDKDQYIRKSIEVFNGWRYCIGIRGIEAYNHTFAEKSEMITKPFLAPRPIKSIMLYSNEVIPDAFIKDITKANEWIQYFISVDDIHWHRISPMHHQYIGTNNFPPKVYKINSKDIIEDTIEHPLYGYIYTDSDVYGIRLKIVISRPTDIDNSESYTPILEDYSLRVTMEEDLFEESLL